MKDAQLPGHWSLANIVSRLREGRFVIPDFQREFEWKPGDISLLMRSIFLDYYIGSLLLWKGKENNFEALACESIYAFQGRDKNREHIVLDGQQRLTAMYYVFTAPDAKLPGRASRFHYFIRVDKFMVGDYDDAFPYDWTRQGQSLIKNSEKQYEKHMFPLSIIGETGFALPNWLQGYENYWKDMVEQCQEGDEKSKQEMCQHAENASSFSKHLEEIIQQYQISFVELDKELEVDKICDIFTQVNSRGVRLDVFDLINALLRPKELKLRHMWRQAHPRLNFINTERMNVYVLQVMSILRQGYCSPKYLYYLLPGQERQVRGPDGSLHKEVLVPDATDFKRRWNQAVDSLEQAIKLLRNPQEFAAISAKYLPYTSILPAFAALQTEVCNLPDNRRLRAQSKIRHWYWASIFLYRYSGSVESTTARDYFDVKSWLKDDTAEPDLISEFRDTFNSINLYEEKRGGTSVYNGIFNLLILAGARDWVNNRVPEYDDLDDHHIVPKVWGTEKNVNVDSILNRTPLTSDTNRNVIRDRLPNEYLPELISGSGEDVVRKILETHFISSKAFDILLRDPFTKNDYDEFLKERNCTIQEAIKNLLPHD